LIKTLNNLLWRDLMNAYDETI